MAKYRISHTKAKWLVAKENQATCLCCGDTIPRATKGRALFCSKAKCKSASRRLKHLRLNKGMTHDNALELILDEISSARRAA